MLLALILFANQFFFAFSFFTHTETIVSNGVYQICWTFDEKNITMELQVETHGYIGFGLSPIGKMSRSDMIIGWTKNGTPHFKDRFCRHGHSEPMVDPHQDWHLISIKENSTHTVMKVTRMLNTCDRQDYPFYPNKTYIAIWSYSRHDPEGDIPHDHGVYQRGTKNITFLTMIPGGPPLPMVPTMCNITHGYELDEKGNVIGGTDMPHHMPDQHNEHSHTMNTTTMAMYMRTTTGLDLSNTGDTSFAKTAATPPTLIVTAFMTILHGLYELNKN